jgi:kynureninase
VDALTATWREEFPGLAASTYLNTCSLGQLSRRSRAAMLDFMDQWQRYGASAWYELWLSNIAEARTRFARMINAQPDEIALLPNISVALSVIAGSLDYDRRPEIVMTELDFPTLPYQWHARARQGAQLKLVATPDRVQVPLATYAQAINRRTSLVATTHVFFTSGYIQDIGEIARLAHEQGALCVVDGYQAAGQLPVDVQAAGVDVYLAGGLKWLLGGPGAVLMYVREALHAQLEPTTTGWMASDNMFSFDPHHFSRATGARRFETGTPAMAAVAALNGGMSIIEEIGVDAVHARTHALTLDLIARLRQAGFAPRVADDLERQSAIVMVPVEDPAPVVKWLAQEQNIIIDTRPGALRISPYFYNTEAENQRVVDALAARIGGV